MFIVGIIWLIIAGLSHLAGDQAATNTTATIGIMYLIGSDIVDTIKESRK